MGETEREGRNIGFELGGEYYPLAAHDTGKDLMLIDRVTGGMSLFDFRDAITDAEQWQRGPILLTLIACSVRAAHPDWTVERILRLVQDLNLSDVEFIATDEEEPDPLPVPTSDTNDGSSKSPSNGSSSSLTLPDGEISGMWSEIPG